MYDGERFSGGLTSTLWRAVGRMPGLACLVLGCNACSYDPAWLFGSASAVELLSVSAALVCFSFVGRHSARGRYPPWIENPGFALLFFFVSCIFCILGHFQAFSIDGDPTELNY